MGSPWSGFVVSLIPRTFSLSHSLSHLVSESFSLRVWPPRKIFICIILLLHSFQTPYASKAYIRTSTSVGHCTSWLLTGMKMRQDPNCDLTWAESLTVWEERSLAWMLSTSAVNHEAWHGESVPVSESAPLESELLRRLMCYVVQRWERRMERMRWLWLGAGWRETLGDGDSFLVKLDW